MKDSIRQFVAIAFCLCFVMGCGSSKGPQPKNAKATIPVKGQLNVDGNPVAGISVFLVPADKAENIEIDEEFGSGSGGTTGADGKFAVTTYSAGDGAPAGDYVVIFRWNVGPLSPNPPDAKTLKTFSSKYGNPSKSEFKQTVNAGSPVDMGLIELTTKAK